MTDTQNQPPQEKQPQKLDAGTLRQMIREEIASVADKLIPGKSTKDSGEQQGQQPDVKGQVAQALAELRSKEVRQKRDERIDKMLEAHEKPPVETPPVERRRVEKIMGWGD